MASVGFVVLLLSTAVFASLRSIDLSSFSSGNVGFEMFGESPNALAGNLVSSAGDFNDDGITDLMVAAPGESSLGRAGSGAVYVLYGKSGAAPFSTVELSSFVTSATTGFKIFGGKTNDGLYTMAGLGDFNGDGIDDIAVGAPQADPPGRANAGIVYVIFGRTTGIADIDLLSFAPSASNGFMIFGELASDRVGNRLTSVGDFNGDGLADLFVYCENYGQSHTVAYVVFGSSTRNNNMDLAAMVANTEGFRIQVEPYTTGIYRMGDVNNDGYNDVGVSNYDAFPNGVSACGMLIIIFGHSTATAFPELDFNTLTSGTSAVRVIGKAEEVSLGYTAGPGGDFNGDGLQDFVVGDKETVFVIFGRAGVASYTDIETATYFAQANTGQVISTYDVGLSTFAASVGDVNDDGVTDVCISVSAWFVNATGQAWVVGGHTNATAFSQLTLSETTNDGLVLRLSGAEANDLLGASVSSGDFNSDGVPDILLGAPQLDADGLANAGAAYVIYGDSTRPTANPSTAPTPAPSAAPSAPGLVSPTSQPSTQPSTQPSINPDVLQTILASPTYKVRNGFAFAAVDTDGKAQAWGEAAYGGDASAVQSQLQSGVAAVVGSRFAFAAVKTDGSLELWGVNVSVAGLARYGALSYAVTSMVANEAAFAGVDTATGRVIAVGSKHHGGNVLDDAYCNGCSSQLAAAVRIIAASAGAFTAIKTDGTLLCWGNKHAGADVASGVLSALSGAQVVVATMSAFAVLLGDNTVASWGDRLGGGDSSAMAGQLIEVHHLTASRSCFVAFKKDSGVVVWGYGKYGGDTSAVAAALSSQVVQVAQTFKAMAVLKADGTVVAWGSGDAGGDASAVQSNLHDITRIYGNSKAFAALTVTGGVVAWGRAAYGGSIPSDKVTTLSSGVVSIAHTDRAFAALKNDGSVVVWGQAGHGGEPGIAVEALLTSGVHTICANDVAFSAIKTDGSVVAWGHSVSVPTAGVLFTSSSLAAGAQCA